MMLQWAIALERKKRLSPKPNSRKMGKQKTKKTSKKAPNFTSKPPERLHKRQFDLLILVGGVCLGWIFL